MCIFVPSCHHLILNVFICFTTRVPVKVFLVFSIFYSLVTLLYLHNNVDMQMNIRWESFSQYCEKLYLLISAVQAIHIHLGKWEDYLWIGWRVSSTKIVLHFCSSCHSFDTKYIQIFCHKRTFESLFVFRIFCTLITSMSVFGYSTLVTISERYNSRRGW